MTLRNTRSPDIYNSRNLISLFDCWTEKRLVLIYNSRNLWEFEGGTPAVSTEQNPTVTYLLPGKYDVKLIVTRPGSVDSLTRIEYIECDSNVGIQSKASIPFRIYPNPCIDGILKIESETRMDKIWITDALGKDVAYYRPNSKQFVVSCQLPDGMYVFRIESGGKLYSTRVVYSNQK